MKAAIEDMCLIGPPAQPQCNITYAKPLNARDVDAVYVNMLLVKEKERLFKEGRCFKCKKQGHISYKCPEKEEKKDALCHENQGMTMCIIVVEEENH